ncbi:MAG TPA: hypothetical protein VEK33_08310 [Terriglobales bacterium]|nr:hypothetical protein [Terriglobales bacterium]
MKSCPDAELLTAFIERRVTSFLREAVTTHFTQCPECTEICARLVNFADANVPTQDAEWRNAEKRLENWMEGFLLSKVAKGSERPADKTRVLRLNEPRRPRIWRKFPWALGTAAAMLIVAAGVFLATRQTQVATRPAAATVATPTPDVPVESTDATPPAQKTPEPIPRPPAGSRKSAIAVASQKPVQPASQARLETAPSSIPSVLNDDQSSQVAQGLKPLELSPNDRIVQPNGMASSARSKPASVARASPRNAGLFSSEAVPAPSRAAPLISSVRLDAGTRIWINVASVDRQPDGSFAFRGTLLQPVAQASSPLAQGTGLTGTGSVRDGNVTLFVANLLIEGSTYAVQPTSVSPRQPAPGVGKAIEFKHGQVMEMWLSSVSIYEKEPAASSGDSVEVPKPR